MKKPELSTDTQRLKLLFPETALSFDFLKKCFEFPGNLPPLDRLILRMRAAFDRCGFGTSFSHQLTSALNVISAPLNLVVSTD